MADEAMFTLALDAELRDQFVAEAEATHQPASQIVREFMRDFVSRQREARAHDTWFSGEVEAAVREADDPDVARLGHEDVASTWRAQRAGMAGRAGEPGA
jgi:predicted transcriptional regulator